MAKQKKQKKANPKASLQTTNKSIISEANGTGFKEKSVTKKSDTSLKHDEMGKLAALKAQLNEDQAAVEEKSLAKKKETIQENWFEAAERQGYLNASNNQTNVSVSRNMHEKRRQSTANQSAPKQKENWYEDAANQGYFEPTTKTTAKKSMDYLSQDDVGSLAELKKQLTMAQTPKVKPKKEVTLKERLASTDWFEEAEKMGYFDTIED